MENTFLAVLQQTASSVGTAIVAMATHIWAIVTKQNIILGLQKFLEGIVMLTGAVLIYKGIKKVLETKKIAELDKRALVILLSITACMLIFFGVSFAINSLPQLLNPEYYTLKESVQMLQMLKK